jgi:26S proteasome regulatory subunit N4
MSFENSDIPVFSSYADPETVPIAEPQYESEPLLKFNEDLTLSLFEDSEGLMNWTNKLHVTPDQNNNQSWGEDLEEMVSDSEDEYFDTDWEEEEEAEKPRFGDLRRESMSVPSSLNNVPPSRASMKTSPMQHVPSITNTMNTTPIKAEEMTPSMTATPPQRLDLSHLTPNAQGLHQCQLTNPSTNQPCLKSFSRPYDLIRHQDTIHAQRKKIFRCIVCSGLYPQALYPDRYGDVEMMDVDSTGKKEKTFSRGDALSRHVRVKHELSGDEATRAIQWAKDNVEYV